MADSPVNCPKCGEALTYRKTGTGSYRKGNITRGDQEVKLYFCERDGFYSLWPNGRLKYVPSSYRPTTVSDLE